MIWLCGNTKTEISGHPYPQNAHGISFEALPLRFHGLKQFGSHTVRRYCLITCLAIKDRISTGQRMRRWGQEQSCPLCGERDESRDNFFFACPYTFSSCYVLCTPLLRRHTTLDWSNTIRAITTRSSPAIDVVLIRMILQMIIYHVWRERNSRIHNLAIITTISLKVLSKKILRLESSASNTDLEARTEHSSLDGLHSKALCSNINVWSPFFTFYSVSVYKYVESYPSIFTLFQFTNL